MIFAKVRPMRTKVTHTHTQTYTETDKPIGIDEILQICLMAKLLVLGIGSLMDITVTGHLPQYQVSLQFTYYSDRSFATISGQFTIYILQ